MCSCAAVLFGALFSFRPLADLGNGFLDIVLTGGSAILFGVSVLLAWFYAVLALWLWLSGVMDRLPPPKWSVRIERIESR